MKKKNWQIAGVEPSNIARAKAEENTAGKIYVSLSEIPEAQFDLITLWHVLEHIADLNTTLKQLKSMLKKDGILFIAVPNHESADAIQYKSFWAGYDVPRHRWHFNKGSMSKLLSKNDLRLIDTRPMLLDSFYVSMLSEKYKHRSGITSTLSGIVSGLKSNLAGRKTMNYSSLIYIASK
jgi:hypothetical protein